MEKTTVGAILDLLQKKAPFEMAEEWDNTGLLVGSPSQETSAVLTALDITPEAVDAAKRLGAGLIVSHHPVIFSPIRRLQPEDIPYRLAREGIAAICAHTNLDRAIGGVNDTLAARLGLTADGIAPDGLSRFAALATPMEGEAFARMVGEKLKTAVRFRGGDRPVKRVCLCSGAGGDGLLSYLGEADAFLTGELKHHEWLIMAGAGVTTIEAGHYATEVPVVDTLAAWISEEFPGIRCTPFYSEPPYTTV